MVISEFNNIKIAAMVAAVSNNWTALTEISDEDPDVIKKFTKKTDATGHFELKTPKDASLQISRGEKVLFRTKAAKDIKIVLDK